MNGSMAERDELNVERLQSTPRLAVLSHPPLHYPNPKLWTSTVVSDYSCILHSQYPSAVLLNGFSTDADDGAKC